MSLYRPHNNPLSVHCAECHKDITLHTQEIYDDKVLCSECFEEVEDTDTFYDEN